MIASPSPDSPSTHSASPRNADPEVQTAIAELVRRSHDLREAGERLAQDIEKLRAATVGNQVQPITASPLPPPAEEIASLAKQLWEEDGKPDGKSQEHWFSAEALVHQRQIATAAGTTATPTPPAAVGIS